MKAKSLLVSLAFSSAFGIGAAYAMPQAPHDPAHNVYCSSCHIPFGGLTDVGHNGLGTATAATTTSITDAALTWMPEQWIGATILFTSGANNGEFRVLNTSGTNTVGWEMPLNAAPAAGDTFELHKTAYEDIEVKCKTCHNPAGSAAANPDAGLHFTGSRGTIGCGTCHDPHNLRDEAGNATTSGYVEGPGIGGLIRKTIELPTGGTASVDYQAGVLTQPAGNGICQACHTDTAYWRNDGTGQGHHPGENCTACHSHGRGFGGGASASAHMDVNGAAYGDHGTGGNHGWSRACQRCHTDGGFKDYIGADGSDNHNDGTYNTTLGDWAYGFGPQQCTTCHNSKSDPIFGSLNTIRFVSLNEVSADNRTALCGTCHQGRESTASVNSKIATSFTTTVAIAYKGLGIVTGTATGGTTTTATGSFAALPASAVGYTLTFTIGANQGQTVTVTAKDATTITFAPALPVATASGDTFTLWATATGGTPDTYGAGTAGPRIGGAIRGIDLVDTNRNWTANQWTNYYVFVQTGPNAGLYRKITGNTNNTLQVANTGLTAGMPFANVMTAGSRYQILPPEDTTVLDTVAPGIAFLNSHYLPAAAVLFGSEALVGYQNPQNYGSGTATAAAGSTSYIGRNMHGGQGECVNCHSPHTLEIEVNSSTCGRCHLNEAGAPVNSMVELEETRQFGFEGDIDGDGDEAESIKSEIDGLAATLFTAMKKYGVQGAHPICYDGAANPYYFKDNGAGGGIAGNGICEAGEKASANAYGSAPGWFTPRLLRAAFNYQVFVKEPGAWAHNPRFMIELLFDALKDMNVYLTTVNQVGYACVNAALVPSVFAVDADGTCTSHFNATPALNYARTLMPRRSFFGHFDGSAGPLRRFDTGVPSAGMTQYPCLQCHNGQSGFRTFLATASFNDLTQPYATPVVPSQSFQCGMCHEIPAGNITMKNLVDVAATPAGGVRFPGYSAAGTLLGNSLTTVLDASHFAEKGDMICATCHSGRDINGATLDAYLGGVYSAQNVVGLPFSGTASIVGNAGNIQITGLPAYRPAVVPYAASGSNWLWNGTTCAATGKYITISGSTNYNGTYAITGCANGTANVAKAYVGDELAVSWAVFAAGTKNNHDIQSAARVYGGEAHVGYEYAGQSYAGLPDHNGDKASCMNCHSPILSRHTMEVEKTYDVGGCGGNGCHDSALHGGLAAAAPAVPYSTFQSPSRNLTTGLGYDNNAGTQTLGDELGSFADNLGVAAAKYFMAKGIKQAAKDPCWNLTTNVLRQANAGNVTAICDGTESTNWATTNAMDPKLIRAWYNMSFYTGDPGAWAHNFDYIAELMYDSARDLGGDAAVATLIRP